MTPTDDAPSLAKRPAAYPHRPKVSGRRVERLSSLCGVILLASTAAAQPDVPLPQDNAEAMRILDAASDTCASDDAGTLRISEGAFVAQDLDGDGDDDLVLNFDHIQCQFNVARWAGTGGTPKWFVLDGTASIEVWGGAWQTIDVQPFADDPTVSDRLILIPVHGTHCDGYGAQPCWRVLVATGGQFSTLPLADQ